MMDQSPYMRWVGSSLGVYRLEQLLTQTQLGPLFSARNTDNNASCLVRALGAPPARSAEVDAFYGAVLQREARAISAFQHPYILPLTDYGVSSGQPYVVWPGLVMRSLSARLAQSGPVDVVTVGRYIDQIAAALEGAHQRGILHLNLSVDNVFLQLDGHLLVADLGIRRLVETLAEGDSRIPFYGSLEACAPEQLDGGRVGAYTDVYALGALTYHLLSGRPVFTGESVEAALQQHLYSRPTPLRGLPAGLEGVLETALAKDPGMRFPQPGAFANAYHQVVAPNSMTRVAFTAGPAGGTERAETAPGDPRATHTRARPSGDLRAPANAAGDREDTAYSTSVSHTAASLARSRAGAKEPSTGASRRRLVRFGPRSVAVSIALVIVVVANALFLFGGFPGGHSAAERPSGDVEFVDGSSGFPGVTDGVRIAVHGVGGPAAGHGYYAWLLNQANERILSLGRLTLSGPDYALAYDSPAIVGKPGANVLAQGDKIEVTVEQIGATAPVGKVILSAAFPPQAFIHIQHLLVGFPTTPGQIGLLVGVLNQTQLVNAQVTLLENAASSGNTVAVQCGAQSVVDIIEGAHGAHARPLDAACRALNVTLVGDGFGLLDTSPSGQGATLIGYLDNASDHASLAATVPDATSNIKLHAGHVETAIANVKRWLTAADQDAVTLLTAPANPAVVADLVTLSDHAYHGVSSDSDQTISPVPAQGGAITAYEHGQFMATLALAPTS